MLLFLLLGLGDGSLLLLLLLLLHGLLFGLLLGLLLLHGLLLLLRLCRSLIVVVIVAAATDQRQAGRANAGPRRRFEQRTPAHRPSPHLLPVVSLAHQRLISFAEQNSSATCTRQHRQ